ncbi:Xylulose kinase [subsurface metagenome]
MLLTIGTGGQIFSSSESPKESPGLSLNTFCHLPESRWYIMGATLAGGLCLRWFRDTFCPGADFDTLSKEASAIPRGAEGLTFLPYLAGRRSPALDPLASGTFTGIRLIHTRGHFVRAVMEGVAAEMHELYTVMQDMGLNAETILCSGGATKSDVWMQILADTFDRPMSITDQDEQACFGAALVAGIGTGVYRDFREAANVVSPPSRIVEPGNRQAEI